MDEPNTLRIVLLGKTGSGKSSLGNTILGREHFKAQHFTNTEATPCQTARGRFDRQNLTLTDTPGFFHPRWSEWQLKDEIARSVSESAPGPHAFLIVLKVEKFTEQEWQVIQNIEASFSPDVFEHAVVVFTHGNQLDDLRIEEFVKKNRRLREVVERCGGRCLVVDNRHWKSNQQDEYRNNQVQVKQLLDTIQAMATQRPGGCYSVQMLREWQKKQSFANVVQYVKTVARKKFVRVVFGVTLTLGVIVLWKIMTNRPMAII